MTPDREVAKMDNNYQWNLRDWLAQIWVRVAGLMLILILLPILTDFLWDYWLTPVLLAGTGNGTEAAAAVVGGWLGKLLIKLLIGGLGLFFGIRQVQGLSHRITAIGLAADAFASRGVFSEKVPDDGRDELARVAFSVNQMMKRLQKIVGVVEQAATGDLTVQIKVKSKEDQFGQALNTMIINLRSLVGQVADNAENMGVDQALIRILPENNCVCFVAFLLGFGSLMYNYRPGEMPLLEAVKRMAQASAGEMVAGMLPAKLFELFNPAVMKNVKAYVEINKDFPSSASSAQLAGSLLTTEMALYLLRDTALATRQAVFAPKFVTLDFFDQSLKVLDITKL